MNNNNGKTTTYLFNSRCVYFVNGSNCVHLSTATELYYTLWCTCTHMFLIPMIFGKWNSVKNVFNECYLKIECESHHLFCIVNEMELRRWYERFSLCFIDEMNFIHQKKTRKRTIAIVKCCEYYCVKLF